MTLDDIIENSRNLIDKLLNETEPKFSNEEYIMMCISLFVAKKENVVRKDNIWRNWYIITKYRNPKPKWSVKYRWIHWKTKKYMWRRKTYLSIWKMHKSI